MLINQIIQYFRDCYKADQRETNIWNIMEKRVEHRLFFEGTEDLLTNSIPHRYIPNDEAEAILKTLQVFEKEKELFYFSFFIAGRAGAEEGKATSICAPILYYPLEIKKDEHGNYYIKIDFDRQQVNYPVLSALDNIENKSYEEDLFDALPQGEITLPKSEKLIQALETYLTEVDFSEIAYYPEQLVEEEALRLQLKTQGLKLMPASCMAVIHHSKTTRGVLNELDEMTQQTHFSKPLSLLLDPEPAAATPFAGGYAPGEAHYFTPAILSKAQQKIVYIAKTQPLSMVIGPPGTGKSYTIASLAIDQINRGKSVLIASRTDTAVDVIADKITEKLDFSEIVVRGGRKQYLQGMITYLEDTLQSLELDKDIASLQPGLKKIKQQLDQVQKRIDEVKNTFEKRVEKEIEWGNYLADADKPRNFIQQWFVNRKTRKIEKQKQQLEPNWELIFELETLLAQRNEWTKALTSLKNQNTLITLSKTKETKQLELFLKGLKASRDSTRDKIFKEVDFKVVLKAFPIWLVNMADIYDLLPLQTELFDIAIIDEASQCDIASSLPILQRAKHVVIVGDTRQLGHISFLSKARQQQLVFENGLESVDPELLDYRHISILDLLDNTLENQDCVTFLNEHYRSLPEIIGFSNQHFYRNALHIMQQKPFQTIKNSTQLISLEGERSKQGYNKTEAEFILQKIKEIIAREKEVASEICHTIGILSPFRNQVNYISHLITKELEVEVVLKHKIVTGTAYTFQGNERDIMFLSWALDAAASNSSFQYLNKADVFNVSITRARVFQYVVTSVSVSQVKATNLLSKYMIYLENTKDTLLKNTQNKEVVEIQDAFAEAVETRLKELGYQVLKAYPIAGIEVDLVVMHQNTSLGVNLIGYPGAFEEAFHLERYQLLQRTGFYMIPLTYTSWTFNQEESLGVIEELLQGKRVVRRIERVERRRYIKSIATQVQTLLYHRDGDKILLALNFLTKQPLQEQHQPRIVYLAYFYDDPSARKGGSSEIRKKAKAIFRRWNKPQVLEALKKNGTWYFYNKNDPVRLFGFLGVIHQNSSVRVIEVLSYLPEKLLLKDLPELFRFCDQHNINMAEMTAFQCIDQLQLSEQGLGTLPKSLENLQTLKYLGLAENKFRKIPGAIPALKGLTRLNVSKNRLTALPQKFSDLSNLRELYLSENKLKCFPENIEKLVHLRVLDIGSNQITEVPEEIGVLTKLKHLVIKSNRIQQIPESVKNLKKMRTLSAGGNLNLPIPSYLGRELINLKALYWSKNQISETSCLEGLKKLEILDLSENDLDSFPAGSKELESLKELNLRNNSIQDIPQKLPPKLIKLNLGGNDIHQLPESLYALKDLNFLNLQKNKLNKVQGEWDRLKSLEILNLSMNKIRKFPARILLLKNLKELYLNNNLLSELSEHLYILRKLEVLGLGGNRLTDSIWEDIFHLKTLKKLYLSGNLLTNIPSGINKLAHLEVLHLTGNQISELPDALRNLKKLQVIHLNDNSLPSSTKALLNAWFPQAQIYF